MNKWKDKW